jgi:hypothetical protein
MDLISQLTYIIEHDLPGEVAHHPLSPLHRPVTSEIIKGLTEYKASAVAIVIYQDMMVLNSVTELRKVLPI